MDPFADHRWIPAPGMGLTFDEHYRLAQLPLVAPGHERAIRSAPGFDYVDGRYERARVSLVADLGTDFVGHATHDRLIRRLERASFRHKIAWGIRDRRAPTLHATLVGGADPSGVELRAVRALMSDAAAMCPMVHGPFVGTFNRGRIYLPFVFDRREDQALLARINDVLGRTPQEIVAAGVVNLVDELNSEEAADLAALIDDMRGTERRHSIRRISWTTTHDDLTLDSKRLETLRLMK